MSQNGDGLLYQNNQYVTAAVPKVVHVPQGVSKIIYCGTEEKYYNFYLFFSLKIHQQKKAPHIETNL